MSLSYRYFAEDTQLMQTGQTVGEWKVEYSKVRFLCCFLGGKFVFVVFWCCVYLVQIECSGSLFFFFFLEKLKLEGQGRNYAQTS